MTSTMLHLPLAENRIAQFAARFERLPTGDWAWHRNDRDAGLLIGAVELPVLIERHADMVRRADKVVKLWIPAAFLLSLGALFLRHGELPVWWPGLFAAPLPWALWQWHKADLLPHSDNPRRMAVAPPRGLGSGARARLRALPLSLPLFMLGISGLLLLRSWQDGVLLSQPHYGLTALSVGTFGVVILWIRRG